MTEIVRPKREFPADEIGGDVDHGRAARGGHRCNAPCPRAGSASRGWALVTNEPVAVADMIDISLDSGSAGALEAADLVFAFGSALNFIIVVNNPPNIVDGVPYYQGYFTDKNRLGEHASVAFVLALREMLYHDFQSHIMHVAW
jgi:hypothetical protein